MTRNRQTLVKLIQDSIDKGATSVEEIHKSIADLPLKILEGSELLKAPAKEVRQLRDHTIGELHAGAQHRHGGRRRLGRAKLPC